MGTVSKEVLVSPSGDSAAPLAAFFTYIDPVRPVLLRRIGQEVADDIHDNFSDSISHDNGATWGAPVARPHGSVQAVEGGFIAHTESAVLYLPETNTLFHFTNDKFETSLEGCDYNASSKLRITSGAPLAVAAAEGDCTVFISDFGKPQGMSFSFCNPILDRNGRILAPVNWPREDKERSLIGQGYAERSDLPGFLNDYLNCAIIIGQVGADGDYAWRLGGTVPYDTSLTSRGLCEPAITELSDGRLAMILRGSNAGHHEMLGCKWMTFSSDGGDTWTPACPLRYDDGDIVESGSTGSAIFRSVADGKLYWLGNPCAPGVRGIANWPRTPLALLEVQQEPFTLKRDTLRIIDSAPAENPQVQHSNFKFYQDRLNGDLVVYLTRYGENGADGDHWLNCNLYQYRVTMTE